MQYVVWGPLSMQYVVWGPLSMQYVNEYAACQSMGPLRTHMCTWLRLVVILNKVGELY